MNNVAIRGFYLLTDYGKKIGDGTPAEVRANEDVISAYLGTSH